MKVSGTLVILFLSYSLVTSSKPEDDESFERNGFHGSGSGLYDDPFYIDSTPGLESATTEGPGPYSSTRTTIMEEFSNMFPTPQVIVTDDAGPEVPDNRNLKGDLATCEEALRQITNVTSLLQRINEQGTEVLQGAKGSKGDQGERGAPSFVKGQKGTKGESIRGPPGPEGPTGLPGHVGMKGDKGPRGVRGDQGVPGYNGIGYPGPKGEKGECVLNEMPGRPGPRGSPGVGILKVSKRSELDTIKSLSDVGSIAYVEDSRKFYGLTPDGWMPLLMNNNVYNTRRRNKGKAHHLTKVETETVVTKKPKKTESSNPNKSQDTKDQPIVNKNSKWNETIISNLRMAALNEPWSGNMDGIDHINYQCQREAMEAGMNGIFRAFLSVRGSNIKSIVRNSKDTIVNIYNKTIFTTWNEVFRVNKKYLQHGNNNHLLAAVSKNNSSGLYSFNGKNVIIDENWDINLIWHGAHLTGRSSHRNCKNWTSNSTADVGIAADFLFKYILHQQDEKCSEKLIVLCIEIPPYFVQEHFRSWETQVANLPVGTGRGYRARLSVRDITLDEYKQLLSDYYLN